MKGPIPSGVVFVLVAAMLWGTTGTAAAKAPGVGPLAIGGAAMGIGGLLQAAAAGRVMFTHRHGLTAQWRTVVASAGAVAVFPLAFYSSMRLAGVAVGTVVSIGSAPPAAAVIERIVDHQPSHWVGRSAPQSVCPVSSRSPWPTPAPQPPRQQHNLCWASP